jgi:hypothetical protein
MTDTTCPACGRTFRSLKGRSGHLATFNDGTHASYRQAHGMRTPLGPDHKPTKAGARVRGAKVQAANVAPSLVAPRAASDAPATTPPDQAGDLKRALQELTEKSLEANRARVEREAVERAWQAPAEPPRTAPSTPVAASEPPASAQTSRQTQTAPPAGDPTKSSSEDWLLVGGAAAAGLGLAALVKSLKGANAPIASPQPEPPAGRPNMQLPSGIWATPEVQPETTGNPWLDSQLGYSGGIRTRRHGL